LVRDIAEREKAAAKRTKAERKLQMDLKNQFVSQNVICWCWYW
jgi:hypothetical protein